MPSGVLPHYQPCLLVWCLIIVHAFCCGASLSAMSVGVVPLCRPCPLVGCLAIAHACWYGTLLSAMPAGVMPHCRSYLLARCHCNHFKSQVQMKEGWLHVWCYLYRGAIKSDIATLRYACLYSTTLSDMHAVLIYSDTRVCKVLLHQARPFVMSIR